MLLFFIAQMIAFAGECNSKILDINKEKHYNVYICDKNQNLENYTKSAVSFFKRNGHNLTIQYGNIEYDCKNNTKSNSIYMYFNNKEVEAVDVEGLIPGAVTNVFYYSGTKEIRRSLVYFATYLPSDELSMLTYHEIGHAIGYMHVDEKCFGYLMNPYVTDMDFEL